MATQAELEFGRRGEDAIEAQLKRFISPDIKHTSSPYSAFDYVSPQLSMAIEVKTRRVASTQYPTTVVGENKLRKAAALAEKHNVRTVFVFSFTDGIHYVEWPFPYEVAKLCRKDRSRGSPHGYINTAILLPLERFGEPQPCNPLRDWSQYLEELGLFSDDELG